MSKDQSKNHLNPSSNSLEDEIDLHEVWTTFSRNKVFIVLLAIAGTLSGGLKAIGSDYVWEGEFKIVVEQSKDIKAGSSLSAKNALAGIGGKLSNYVGLTALKTEIEILQSPSVLKPVYEFYISEKKKVGEGVGNLSYRKWKVNNLGIRAEGDTSILRASFRDTNKEIISKVINRISESYKLYSSADYSRNLKKGLKYNKDQVTIFREKYKRASRDLDKYSLRYGISPSVSNIMSYEGMGRSDSSYLELVNLENTKNSLATKFNTKRNRQSDLSGDLYSQLAKINKELLWKKRIFTENDPIIKNLIKERESLKEFIAQTAGGTISLPIGNDTKETAQEILLNFLALSREASRTNQTLEALESKYLELQLEMAKQQDPWKLISQPSILEYPVAPNKKLMVIIGLVSGLLTGCIIALIKDKFSGKVYTLKELSSLLPCDVIAQLSKKDSTNWIQSINLLANGKFLQSKNTNIGIIPIGSVVSNSFKDFTNKLAETLDNNKLIITNDLVKTKNCSDQLLVLSLGKVTRKQIFTITQELNLQGTSVTGCILLEG
tara:strand:- start:5609 stop:7258 length:1650 start_codon:yes stop_codon:yes gene_type:complete